MEPDRVGDLGFAKDSVGGVARHTGHGTYAYAAPELFAPNPTATPAGDVYALGVVAYELLTGELPYGSEVPSIIAGAMGKEPVALPSTLPHAATDLLRGCLAKDPEQRWTVRQILGHLGCEADDTKPGGSAVDGSPKESAGPAESCPSTEMVVILRTQYVDYVEQFKRAIRASAGSFRYNTASTLLYPITGYDLGSVYHLPPSDERVRIVFADDHDVATSASLGLQPTDRLLDLRNHSRVVESSLAVARLALPEPLVRITGTT